MIDFSDWVGRQEESEATVDPQLAARLVGAIDARAGAQSMAPQGFHWCLATPDVATAELGPDGHPRRDGSGLLPPVTVPRRMWASSEVSFLAPLRLGDHVRRSSRLAAVNQKSGASGPLVFVEIDHQWSGESGALIRERQTIVYREAAAEDAPLAPPLPGPDRFVPDPGTIHRVVTPSEVLLFRFSALTFNSHRIHYDLPYAVNEERYRGLVVHGPLTATLLLDLASRAFGDQPLKHFAFRGISPAVAGEPLHLVLASSEDRCELDAYADDGRHVMSAKGTRSS
ncbi:FAS1-like dehydratase domain-containing protein [Sphingopyxis terrae]|uniref:FAS1-like dehydratase domain-containing protein n=1 Tax=Sphingopyxis terrae TaxID=33052 RepID=UPI002A0ADD52|nr:MaoC family dehydratase N-terminal domain-containing protein [Sphingopyxis terrae]MDX8356416.1 MaoC family dehydratase N-terminal domain-containing protein [Sphingopyxis terrae]